MGSAGWDPDFSSLVLLMPTPHAQECSGVARPQSLPSVKATCTWPTMAPLCLRRSTQITSPGSGMRMRAGSVYTQTRRRSGGASAPRRWAAIPVWTSPASTSIRKVRTTWRPPLAFPDDPSAVEVQLQVARASPSPVCYGGDSFIQHCLCALSHVSLATINNILCLLKRFPTSSNNKSFISLNTYHLPGTIQDMFTYDKNY